MDPAYPQLSKQEKTMIKRIALIVNPGAGRAYPILHTVNRILTARGIDWDIFVTKNSGEAFHLAEKAVKQKVDAVAVYGGDGTVIEAASGLLFSEVPLVILPGGTGNVFASELRIPSDPGAALEHLLTSEPDIRKIDVGQFDNQHFILRASFGFEAVMMKKAPRTAKDNLGKFAYLISVLKALPATRESEYQLTVDGRTEILSGLSCVIANSGNLGIPGLSLLPGIQVDDGVLDAIIIKRPGMDILQADETDLNSKLMEHRQGREITVRIKPAPQDIQIDGELITNQAELRTRVTAGALRVIVGKPEE